MKKVGLVGARGMIGSTLLARMREEGDDQNIDMTILRGEDAARLENLRKMDVLLVCRGGDYTRSVYGPLRTEGWKGFWIDASSALRMERDSCLVLDPVNRPVIDQALRDGVKTYVGANCTVSLMLMALSGLFRENLVEWVNSDTYQAASGAGSAGLAGLLDELEGRDWSVGGSPLEREQQVRHNTHTFADSNTKTPFKTSLATNLIPWIGLHQPSEQTTEEWKGSAESQKILNSSAIKVDGTCVRVPTLRCHAQSFTVKLTREVPIEELSHIISEAHQWVRFVPNDEASTLEWLSTPKISGTLHIPVGRLRKSLLGKRYIKAFSMGDQLLWGGAEPLRRALNIILAM